MGDDIKLPLRYRAAGQEGARLMGDILTRKFRVLAPYVMLKVVTPDGVANLGFYTGAYVTGCTDETQVRHHLTTANPGNDAETLIEEIKAVPAGAAVHTPETPVQLADQGTPGGEANAAAEIDAGQPAKAPARARAGKGA